jgi:RNA-directed DNA polymerase
VTGATKEILEQQVKPALTAFLAVRGLRLSEQKTVLTHIREGFDFLGHTVRKYEDKLLITPAKSKVVAMRKKIGELIHAAVGLTQEALLRQLNPLLRGWANYYRHGASQQTFDSLDYHVYKRLKRWAKRRHPNKSASWRWNKYHSADGTFSVGLSSEKGAQSVLALYRTASTKIQRHIKVRADANPYDPKYTQYFNNRNRSRRRRLQDSGEPLRRPRTVMDLL